MTVTKSEKFVIVFNGPVYFLLPLRLASLGRFCQGPILAKALLLIQVEVDRESAWQDFRLLLCYLMKAQAFGVFLLLLLRLSILLKILLMHLLRCIH